VPLSNTIRQVLREYLKKRGSLESGDRIFANRFGDNIDGSCVRKIILRAGEFAPSTSQFPCGN